MTDTDVDTAADTDTDTDADTDADADVENRSVTENFFIRMSRRLHSHLFGGQHYKTWPVAKQK